VIYEDKEPQTKPLNENQFLLSIGKHSGARAVTIDGLRKILVKLAQIQNKRDEGDDAEKRIERLLKKSYFENEMIAQLFANEKQLDDKERKQWREGKNFIENPSALENIVRDKKSVTINAILTEETTIWKFGESKTSSHLDSFGWVLCEFISNEEFQKEYKLFREHEKSLIEEKNQRQQEAIETIQKAKDEVLRLAQEKEVKKLQEKQKVELEANRLATLSPLDLKIEELVKAEPNKTMTEAVIICNSVKNGKLEEYKKEALERAKQLMIDAKEWIEDPKGKKKYKRTMEVKSLMGIL